MKAISFEAIRNLLRTKKKSADDYGDASFKRSDSFKRISIRRSYLNRGRKRAIHAFTSGAHHTNQPNGKLQHVHTVRGQEPTSVQHHQNIPLSNEQYVNVQVNSDVREPINISSRIEETVEQNYHRINSEIEANIKNGKNKSSKISIRNSVDDNGDVFAGACVGASIGNTSIGIGSVADERQKIQRRSSKSKHNKYEEVTTSTSCFVKAGNMLKKPIGTGLDVTAADSIERAVNSYSQRDSFYEIFGNSENEFDPNRKQSFVYKSRPKSYASIINDDSLSNNRVCIRQPNSVNSSKRSSDFVTLNDSSSDNDIWSARSTQSIASKPDIHKSISKQFNEENARNSDSEMPSFVIFKTFSNEQNASGYKETCFNNVEDESKNIKDHEASLRSNTYTKKHNDNVVSTGVSSSAAAAAARKPDIAPGRRGRGVVIKISDSGYNIDNLSHSQIKEALNKKLSRDSALGDIIPDCSEDETSLNGKFTFEIYKQIRTSKKSENSFGSKFIPSKYDGSTHNVFNSHDVANSNTSDSVKSPTLNESFASMHICDKIDNNFFLEPDTHEYNDVNVIPYPLRIKINPFTNQKEPYSVNLGRVWKQLNLGQDDQSLETSTEKANSKVKNDSFRSISSHDSGFSLTLTKQKSLFNRKQNKKSKRKSKVTLTKDGQFKKMPANGFAQIQRNGVRRSKKKQFKQRISPTSSKFQLKFGSNSMAKAKPAAEFNLESNKNPCETFLDRYCDNIQQKLHTDEVEPTNYSFSQEISDLEAFFEEHLKRLKEYYLQKKKINDQTIDEICSKCEGKRTDLTLAVSPTTKLTHVDESTTLKSPNTYLNRCSNNAESDIIPDDGMADIIGTNKLSYDVWNDSMFNSFDFPYPDKRSGTNTKNRTTCPINEIRISNDLDYASLDFSNHLQNKQLKAPAFNCEMPEYCTGFDHLKNFNDDDLLKEKQSMIVNYNSAGELLFDGSDDEYEDILNEHELADDDVCVLCDKIKPECECSMNRKLANVYSITPENILCNCMRALNAPVLKPNYAKNSKTVKKNNTCKSRQNGRKSKRSKRIKWQSSKNHSLRREYVACKCIFPISISKISADCGFNLHISR